MFRGIIFFSYDSLSTKQVKAQNQKYWNKLEKIVF